MTRYMSFALLTVFCLQSCGEETLPKPRAYLRLEYPSPQYKVCRAGNCPFSFEKNEWAKPLEKKNCWMDLEYSKMKATLYLSYMPVKDNLDSLLFDAQKLAYSHAIKAEAIPEQPFVNADDGVYGMFYATIGDAASQSQFYLTDSTQHFITGSLYFCTRPNYDSIYPAAVYLQKDIRHLMETFRWE